MTSTLKQAEAAPPRPTAYGVPSIGYMGLEDMADWVRAGSDVEAQHQSWVHGEGRWDAHCAPLTPDADPVDPR
ncbi:hypothetical protein ACXZ65_36405 [Streptomyces aculeolatus]